MMFRAASYLDSGGARFCGSKTKGAVLPKLRPSGGSGGHAGAG
jgi:hypothetical protein